MIEAMRSIAVVVLAALAGGCDDAPVAEFAVSGEYLAIRQPGGELEPIFVKGMNLGVGIPGTYPGQLALDRDTYLRWFAQMEEIGVNTVRIYTLHHPVFYESLFEFNNLRPYRPLYVLHGAWLDEENPTGGIDLYDYTEQFDVGIEEVIDAVHGNADIDHRLGHGFGHYEVDVSQWVLGYLIGRETYPVEVVAADTLHAEDTSFDGRFLRIADATPTEAWITARLDHVLDYEMDRYGEQRPIAYSNWPTLDPLTHPTEPHPDISYGSGEFVAEDGAQFDVTRIDASRAAAGLFASYHAYPYYPDFMFREPGYIASTDHVGPNNYVGYLAALREHYRGMPLLIGEYGVPSSWGNAHVSPTAGFDHGGHDEVAQGEILARLTRNIHDTGCAGAIAFAWMDEWWKNTWIVQDYTYPIERYPLWWDVMSPERNFGLIAWDIGEPTFQRWPATPGSGRIGQVETDIDAAYVHIRVALSSPLADGDQLVVGFDTHRDDLGESVLPDGAALAHRAEFALAITAAPTAQLYVTEAYNRYGFRDNLDGPEQMGRSIATDGAPWVPWAWVVSLASSSDDGVYMFAQNDINQGAVRIRRASDPASSLDAIVLGDGVIDIRLPWTLLHFADPSARQVMADDLTTIYRRESLESDGIRIAVSIGSDLVSTPRLIWDGWEEPPPTTERSKPAMATYAAALAELPDRPQ